jgi:hypothetical protein
MCLKKAPAPREEPKERTVIMLGINGAGKTKILERLAIRPEERLTTELSTSSSPTTGINIQQMLHGNTKFEFWEVSTALMWVATRI